MPLSCRHEDVFGRGSKLHLFLTFTWNRTRERRLLYPRVTNTLDKSSGVPREGGWFGVSKHPPTEIPKALQNGVKHNPIVKTVKNGWI